MPSSVEHIIHARTRDLGGFMVRRVLPAFEKQMAEDGDGFVSPTRPAIGQAATADVLITSVFSQTSSPRIFG